MSVGRALVPLAIAIAVIAAAVGLMLLNDIVLGPWLLALLVFAHGWVHLMFVFPRPESPNTALGGSGYPFDFGRSWLIRRAGIDARPVRVMGIALMSLVFALTTLAALASVSLVVPAEWWSGLMILAALSSSLMLVLFFSPALVLGFATNAAMVVLVLSGSWSPG